MRRTILIPESALQIAIVELAHLTGWLVHHTRPAVNRRGQWATPIQGDPGFPDLVLAKPGRLLIVELKSEKGGLTPDQKAWLTVLSSVALTGSGFEVYIWRPSDFDDIKKVLVGGKP